MTATTPGQLPPIDPGNPLILASPPLPVTWTTAAVNTPDGQQLLLLTFRTPDTTLTVKLTRSDATTLAQSIAAAAQGMSGLVVAPANGLLR